MISEESYWREYNRAETYYGAYKEAYNKTRQFAEITRIQKIIIEWLVNKNAR